MSPRHDPMHEYYEAGTEESRLASGAGLLERDRTREILRWALPAPPADLLDVGGGPGAHACWLATLGYRVHLIDPVPLHVEQARRASAAQPDHPIVGAEIGDARRLGAGDESADAVLLLGPLYHLVRRAERLDALREARRVLRPGGVAVVATISRYASALDGLLRDLLADPGFVQIVAGDLRDGRHVNPAGLPDYFTTAYFHAPGELEEEIDASGLRHEQTVAVEGVGWLMGDLEQRLRDPDRRARLMGVIRLLEREPALLGASAHQLAIARKEG